MAASSETPPVNMAASSEPPPSAQPLSLDLDALDPNHSALDDMSAPGTSASSKEWMSGVEKFMSDENEMRRFCDCVLAATQKILSEHGGPVQYLRSRYNKPEKLIDYAAYLTKEFPEIATHPISDLPLKSVMETNRDKAPVQVVHISKLGFDPLITVAGLPARNTCYRLIDEMLADSFVTGGEPLILREHTGPVEDFGLSYIKGLSRVSALHLLITVVRDDGVSLQQVLEYVMNRLS